MAQGGGFDQILVEPQVPADGPGHPGQQLHVQDPVGEMIVSDQRKYLGFVNVAGERQGVENPVGILAERLAVFVVRPVFRMPPNRGPGRTGQGLQGILFDFVQKRLQIPGFFQAVIQDSP
jgi:hypothetical protein